MDYQLKAFGNILILFAFVGLSLIFIPVTRQEVRYQFKELLQIRPSENIKPKDTSFGIVIPKIDANSQVFANTSTGNENEYQAVLAKGVAHAKGTDFPGGKDNIYLFAHSTGELINLSSFNAVFYLLHKLENQDEIILYYKNRRFSYYVYDKKIVEASDVEYLTKKYVSTNLTLQTCWPPGTTLKRLLVFAKPK
jgi:sortase A